MRRIEGNGTFHSRSDWFIHELLFGVLLSRSLSRIEPLEKVLPRAKSTNSISIDYRSDIRKNYRIPWKRATNKKSVRNERSTCGEINAMTRTKRRRDEDDDARRLHALPFQRSAELFIDTRSRGRQQRRAFNAKRHCPRDTCLLPKRFHFTPYERIHLFTFL